MKNIAISVLLVTALAAAAAAMEININFDGSRGGPKAADTSDTPAPKVPRPLKEVEPEKEPEIPKSTNTFRTSLDGRSDIYSSREAAAADAAAIAEKFRAAGYNVLGAEARQWESGLGRPAWEHNIRYATRDGSPAWNVQRYGRILGLDRRPYRTLAAAQKDARAFGDKFRAAGYTVLNARVEYRNAEMSGLGCESWKFTLEYIAPAGRVPGKPEFKLANKDVSGAAYIGDAGCARALADSAAMDASLRAAGNISLGFYPMSVYEPQQLYVWYAEYLRPLK